MIYVGFGWEWKDRCHTQINKQDAATEQSEVV